MILRLVLHKSIELPFIFLPFFFQGNPKKEGEIITKLKPQGSFGILQMCRSFST